MLGLIDAPGRVAVCLDSQLAKVSRPWQNVRQIAYEHLMLIPQIESRWVWACLASEAVRKGMARNAHARIPKIKAGALLF